MTTLRTIAEDPSKALMELEKSLGIEPGDLVRDMKSLGPPGEAWREHLSYCVADSYYDDEEARRPLPSTRRRFRILWWPRLCRNRSTV